MINMETTKMSIKKILTTFSIIGTVLVASLTVSNAVQAQDNPFAQQAQPNGFIFVAEGKCGEGKCGGSMKKKEGKCGEGKCGDGKGEGEGKCGDGKKKEGKCGGN